MPKEFDACVEAGGKVRTLTQDDGVMRHICFPKDGGQTVVGEEIKKKVYFSKEYGTINYKVQIIKEQDQQLITGVVMEPDEIDSQGDETTSLEIQRAAHSFQIDSRVIGRQHEAKALVDVVETHITDHDYTVNEQPVKKGSWVMTVKVNDPDLWREVKEGKITGFSIGGYDVKA